MENFKKNLKWYFLGLLLLVVCLVWYAVFAESNKNLKVVFLDVGQGDAIFIETPAGRQVLIDGGINKNVLSQLGKVMPFYDRSLDLVLATHQDNDHVGGLRDVLKRYEIGNIFNINFVNQEKLIRGDRIDLGSGVYLNILMPPINPDLFDSNNSSLVARLVYGQTSFLLTGDMETKMENYLVGLSDNLKSDVLKVGHHGSRTSTSDLFLGTVSPDCAVISVGADNKYGHPHQETLDKLARFGVDVLRTDQLGTIAIKSDGEKVFCKSF